MGPTTSTTCNTNSNSDSSDSDSDTAFDSLCIGVSDVRINPVKGAAHQFEMLYFGGTKAHRGESPYHTLIYSIYSCTASFICVC